MVNKLASSIILFVIAIFISSLTDGPYRSSELKSVTGKFQKLELRKGRKRNCLMLYLRKHENGYELCSNSYREFDRSAFRNSVKPGHELNLVVVDELKENISTGEKKYWVQGITSPKGRVFLDFDELQELRASENSFGKIAVFVLLGLTLGVWFVSDEWLERQLKGS